MPQLPKEQGKFEKPDLDKLATKAVQMLVDYAKQCLADANAFVVKAQQKLSEQEIDHPDNEHSTETESIKLTSDELRQHLDLMDRALHLTSEALDIPQMKVGPDDTTFLHLLVSTYLEHRDDVDQILNQNREKWRVERMVTIDRDILRLACTEAFFLREVPINVCISEAVELSHRFADDRAAKFINGVLRDIAEEAKAYRSTGKFSTASQEA
jgi:N utilization substance protein B